MAYQSCRGRAEQEAADAAQPSGAQRRRPLPECLKNRRVFVAPSESAIGGTKQPKRDGA